MEIHTLACKAHVPVALKCLASLVRCSRGGIDLIVHDDGSLDGYDRDRLLDCLPQIRFVDRKEADAQMGERLSGHRACASYRRAHVLGLKLFDTTLMCQSETVNFCDTDVFLFAPVVGMFDRPDGVDAIFMRDCSNAFSLRSWSMLRHGVPMIARTNTGLLTFPVDRFDLDRVEWFLRLPHNPTFRHFQEQSAWAFLASTCVTHHWADSQVRVVQGSIPLPREIVAGHYVASHRDQLNAIDETLHRPHAVPVRLSTETAPRLGALGMAIEEAQRPLWRRVPGLRSMRRDRYA